MTTCATCGHASTEAFKFCPECGAAAGATTPARESRKIVTIVFCDLTGSTALGDRTDPEALRATMRSYYEEMRVILERHGGTVEKFVGDAVMAVFGVPVSHEDDGLRAVRAAWEMRAAVATLGLQARIGVNTGEVVAGEGDTLVTGDAVNVAARLEQAADPGEVLIGAETQRLVRDAAKFEPLEVTAKGKAGTVAAFRLLDVDMAADAISRRLDTRLIGRAGELRQLEHVFERVAGENRCQLFTLLGAAGVGKSRLTAEFLAGVDATVLHGRCLDYGEGITFWPVVAVLKQLGARADATLEQLVEGGSSPNELFWAVRTQLEEVARERPLVVVFDDIQWGEPMFLDLLDHIADLSRGAPILLLCLARPDLLDRRPGWGGGKLNATTMLLESLSADDCGALIDAHGPAIGAETRTRILAAADGNPLFVEEMVALAHEDGDARVPATVQALLQARLDQLGTEERSVMERGAIEGQVFHRGAVLELTDGDTVEPQLNGLVRKELILPERTTYVGDHAFRFRHLLIRDAAYDSLPKETRADLHERFATWLESHARDLIELDEVVGYHLEQSALYRRELGRGDAGTAQRAAVHLAAAGSKAAARSDAGGADNLLTRAHELAGADDPLRPMIVLEHIAVLEELGRRADQARLIEELEQHTDHTVQMHGQMARLQMRISTDPHAVIEEAERVSQEALEVFAAARDELGLARTWYLLFWIEWLQSRAGPALAAIDQITAHAERAGARALAGRATAYVMGPLLYGPFPVDTVNERLDRLRKIGGPMATNTILRVEAHLARLEGRFEEALALHDKADRLVADLGMTVLQAIEKQWATEVMLVQGRTAESVGILRDSNAELEALGETSFRSTTVVRLGEALYQLGETDEAERRAIEGEEIGAAEDVVNFAMGRGLRARIEADRGEHDAAERLAREALAYAYKTDFPGVHAQAHASLAYVLKLAGRIDEARAELESGIAAFESYGNVFEAERARALLVQL